MYKLIFTALIVITSLQSYGQYTPADSTHGIMITPEFIEVLKADHKKNEERAKAINKAGILLEKSGKQGLASVGLVVLGSVITVISLSNTDQGSGYGENTNPGAILGGLLGVTGFTLGISSHVTKRKAGTILKQIE